MANWLLASGYGLQGETTKLLGPVFKFARRKADNDYGYDYVDDPVFGRVPSRHVAADLSPIPWSCDGVLLA